MRPLAFTIFLTIAGQVPSQPPDPPTPVLPIPTRDVVAALIESLGDADPEVRQNAAVSLAYAGTDAVEPLTNTLRGANHDARAAAAYALGQIGGPAAPATPALVKALKDDDKEVRRQASQALGRIIAGTRPQPSEQRPLTPPVPVDAPPPVFPPVK